MRAVVIRVEGGMSGFTEDKDQARELRKEKILPAVEAGKNVIIDFSEVKNSTQSFVHALIGEVLQHCKETALERLEFRSCNPQLRSLVQLVVDYSLAGFSTEPEIEMPRKTNGKKAKRK